MNPKDFLQSELQNSASYELTELDDQLLDGIGIEGFIYSKLTSKKFRKWAIDEGSVAQVKKAISISVASNSPLKIRYPFGGYKLWSMPGSPEVDWAEYFSIAYYIKYLAPAAAAYKPGVELIFSSDDVIIERMDNVAVADTDAYFRSFKKLLEYFRKYLPSNITIDIVRVADMYLDKVEFERELGENITKVKAVYADSTDEQKKQKMYTTSALNIKWQGVKDLTGLNDTDKKAIIEMGPIYHDAYGALSKRRQFVRGEDKIVMFTTLIPNAIAIGTTKSTVTKFWTGMGVLKKNNDGYLSQILSPKQMTAIEAKQCDSVPIDIIKMKNFKTIRVY